MSFYTYIHTKKDTGEIFYVGKGQNNRAFHKYDRSKYWQNTVKKHGYEVSILAHWENEVDAYEHEKLLILCFKDMNINLVNLTNGGDGVVGYIATDEVKEKMSDTWKQKYKFGYENPKGMIGKLHSEETIAKMKATHAKRDCSMSEETRKKLSISSMGKPPTFGMKGKKHSDQTKVKLSLVAKGRPWTEARRLASKKD
jgi:hypothetical protein